MMRRGEEEARGFESQYQASIDATSSCQWILRTIASDDKELVLARVLVNGNVGVGGDDLVLGLKGCALLELEVSEGAR